MTDTLRQHPDFDYYLQDILFWYRNGSAGGSKPIRSHMKAVRTALKAALGARPEIRFPEPMTRPVCTHLNRAVDNGTDGPTGRTVRVFSRISGTLRWEFGYDRMPRHLESAYAYAEILGPRGPVVSENLIIGVVLLAPRTLYPGHSHQDLTESYICLSGALSQNDAGVYVPGSLIFNPPQHHHRITTGLFEPCLLSYAWIGSPEAIAYPKMKFQRSASLGGSPSAPSALRKS